MLPTYEENEDNLEIKVRPTMHIAPHLHTSTEIVLLEHGTYALGMATELFSMEKGDIGIIFPGMIHHFQGFSGRSGKALHILAAPSYLGAFSDIMTEKRPEIPIIRKEDLRPEIMPAIRMLQDTVLESRKVHLNEASDDGIGKLRRMTLRHACFQIILALLLPELTLKDREDISDFDPVYQVVSYIARHFREDISLLTMAKALGIGEYRLSRIFSSTFHQNFNHYLNEVRLNYVTSALGDSDRQITDIALDAGFQSQATFNRVFRDRMHMTPREYRKMIQFEEKEESFRK